MICTLCSSELINKKDAYYYHCDTCKALVKDKKYYLSSDEEKARYETHNNDVNDIGYQNFTLPITNYVTKNCSPNHKGLDFGSGTGPVISSMLKKLGFDIEQYDPFFAPNPKPLIHQYDYILSCEVFEHFHQPKLEIDRLFSLLNKNGILLIMTMLYIENIDFGGWNYRNDDTHVFIYRKETIEYIAEEWKLEIDVLTDRLIVLRKLRE
ncbi:MULTISPECIES: class I SAM-dependent methyltransferase [unclassified Lentimicrobium]|uniref:class I SAM-dependent methyltransferase n=1 Tax=unclassified Lentimicrobium TaxID=2677434 RepID=UPI0015534726|nr:MULTISPECIES: class I SAM-dependent methyltransferase [unclassified Lentimicrobium]NPD45689.1 class I SAM-dependent methyltransferase [Lentimicrobium sp. S6]NPD85568.1 class I SAM-dependent methyltransferase [Lentimicrobium sp. L6]